MEQPGQAVDRQDEQQSLDSATLAKAFDADYFTYHCGPVPYERNEEFLKLFDYISGHVARDIEPTSVFDAGCAIGLLVEGLRKHGVEAYGMDISEFAISQV